MKIINHVYAIKNLMSNGPVPADYSYSDRLVTDLLSIIRAKLIEEKANKYHSISEQSYQSLCLDLEESNFHNCCDVPDVGCSVLKSVARIPKFLTTRWGNIAKVTTLDGLTIPKSTVTISNLSKYSLTMSTKPSIGWFIHDGYLYIINNTHLRKVLLNALFDEPATIELLNCDINSSEGCGSYLDQEFPIDTDLIDPMYKLTIQYLLNGYKLPEDTEADFSSKIEK